MHRNEHGFSTFISSARSELKIAIENDKNNNKKTNEIL